MNLPKYFLAHLLKIFWEINSLLHRVRDGVDSGVKSRRAVGNSSSLKCAKHSLAHLLEIFLEINLLFHRVRVGVDSGEKFRRAVGNSSLLKCAKYFFGSPAGNIL